MDSELAAPRRRAIPVEPDDEASSGRQLFKYISGEEWREYRIILKVFADTSFAEFTPDQVAVEVLQDGVTPEVVPDRLESLRRWGNLAVSSSVGNPSSLEDYYRRRNRYLITRSGQAVFELVEGVLAGFGEIGDVEAGRLPDLHRALRTLVDYATSGLDRTDSESLTSTVRTIFDLHDLFTTELTQFFADLNQWQSRYDLNTDEVQLFAGVLVSYVGEKLTEIQRMAPPIARALAEVRPHLPTLVPALNVGLAARVDAVELGGNVAVRRMRGTQLSDWEHLEAWFSAPLGRQSRLDRHTRQALTAVRTLTANVTRLSRVGLGTASKRSDFIRLAGFFDRAATADEAHEIASAAFGLGSCRRLGTLAEDADDPMPTNTSWVHAPRAVVPVSLKEHGGTNVRGSPTPIRNRRVERSLMRQERERQRMGREAAAAELLSCAGDNGLINGADISTAAFSLLRDLISRSGHRAGFVTERRSADESGVICTVRRANGATTVVDCPDGRLIMQGLVVAVAAAHDAAGKAAEALSVPATS